MANSWNDAGDPNHAGIVNLIEHINGSSLKDRDLTYAVGLKFRDRASIDVFHKSFRALDVRT